VPNDHDNHPAPNQRILEQDNDTLKAPLYKNNPATIIYALLKQGSKATNTKDVQPGRSYRTQLQQLISI